MTTPGIVDMLGICWDLWNAGWEMEPEGFSMRASEHSHLAKQIYGNFAQFKHRKGNRQIQGTNAACLPSRVRVDGGRL